MAGFARTCCSSCCFDSSSTWPGVGAVAAYGLAPLALNSELFSSATQPSRIGFGSIIGAPTPAGRIWKSTCGWLFALTVACAAPAPAPM